MNKIVLDDINSLLEQFDMRKELCNKTVFVTGATGLIGKLILFVLCRLNEQYNTNIKLLALIRDKHKAHKIFCEFESNIIFIEGDIKEKIECEEKIDYIIHCASNTQSRHFTEYPVETINTNVIGTQNVLELARNCDVKSVVYLSSMEVYGFKEEEHVLKETDINSLEILTVRSSYPESKRMAENLCIAYYSEYGIPIKILRLAQTFGAGVNYSDDRVFAEFAKCILSNRNINLVTEGKSKRMYLYTMDAVKAIMTVMLRGEAGEVYNVAAKNTYCSIREMAQLVIEGAEGLSVNYEFDYEKSKRYSPTHYMYLDTSKIEALGWKPEYELREMFKRMIAYWTTEEGKDV